MSTRRALTTSLIVAAVLGVAPGADAQLAKQGKYSGTYQRVVSTTPYQLEAEHVYTQDVYRGSFFNDAGEGFLHQSEWVCPGINDLIEGKGTSRGYCTVTDNDGDKAYNSWEGTVDPKEGFEARLQWTGGTGKYAGLRGDGSLQATTVMLLAPGPPLGIGIMKLPQAARPTGRVRVEGEYRLP